MIQTPAKLSNQIEINKVTATKSQFALTKPKQWDYLQRRYELTPRERQVAELVCRGYHNGDVAGRLDIAAGTVKTHIRNIYRKVRVRNKISMLLKFIEESNTSQFTDLH